MLQKLLAIKEAVSQVFAGYAGCSTGGCCGVSLPKADQDALKKLKEQQKWACSFNSIAKFC